MEKHVTSLLRRRQELKMESIVTSAPHPDGFYLTSQRGAHAAILYAEI